MPDPHLSRRSCGGGLAIVAILAIMVGGVTLTATDNPLPTVFTMPGATAEPTGPPGPTGPGPGSGSGGSQFQPPDMGSIDGGYSGGNYPAPPQGNGIDINNPSAAPGYDQAPQYPQQQQPYPSRQPPVHGTQPPDYDAPPQQQAPTQQPAQQEPQEPAQVQQEPSATSTPEPSQEQDAEQDSQPPRRDCDEVASSVAITSVDGLAQQFVDTAAQRWTETGNTVSSAANAGGAPVAVIGQNTPTKEGKATYAPATADRPAEIRINLAKVGSEDELLALLTHELGHAFGLPDASSGGSLMALTAGSPQPADLDTLSQIRTTCAHGADETLNAPYDRASVVGQTYREDVWDLIRLRRGYWDEKTPNAGFGFDKAWHKHNLRRDDIILGVVENADRGVPASNPNYTQYQKTIYQIVCVPGGECENGQNVDVVVVADHRTEIPAAERDPQIPVGDSVGVITAYCKGMPQCPEWLNLMPGVKP